MPPPLDSLALKTLLIFLTDQGTLTTVSRGMLIMFTWLLGTS